MRFIDNPLDTWISKFFKHAGEDAKNYFAAEMGTRLRFVDDVQQQEWWKRWLREYWENRQQGRPKPLNHGETERMLGWLPLLRTVFPEAVDLAITHNASQRLNAGDAIYELAHGELYQNYPDAVAKLVIYLGTYEGSDYSYAWGHTKTQDMIQRLLQSNLSGSFEEQLRNLAVKRGIA